MENEGIWKGTFNFEMNVYALSREQAERKFKSLLRKAVKGGPMEVKFIKSLDDIEEG